MPHDTPPLPVIAIDGTAASGKGTLARRLGETLGFSCLDTGALYRLVALKMLESGTDAADEAAAAAFARALREGFTPADTANPAIRTEAASQMTSKISAHPAVRAELLDMQRNFSKVPPPLPGGAPARGAILDGRDIGTVICPDAPVKFFISATTEIRAERRWKELQSQGIPVTYEAVLAEMRERDARDTGRATAPTKPASDAIILDTTAMTAAQVLDAALAHIGEKLERA